MVLGASCGIWGAELSLYAIDVSQAFMNSPLRDKERIVLRMPLSISTTSGEPIFLEAHKALNGLRVASFTWSVFLKDIVESLATPTPGGRWSGGVAVLVPPGYVLKDSHNLVQGRAVAALIADRTSQYYIVSVYLHPDKVRQDLAALLQALQGLASPDARIILAGDFNRADERCAGAWDSFLEILHVYDVFPSLGTFRHPRGLSPLDRCLVPNDWVSSARWNPSLCAIEPRGAQGHLILKMQVRLKPCVLNSPSDPKHATIPSNTFMPGKDGSTPRDISSLYGLVRLLHRQHNELFADTST